MKICFLISGLGLGGAERYLLHLIPRLKFNTFIISLLNLNEIGKILEKKGIRIYYLGINRINFPLVIIKFRKIIKSERPDVLDTYLIHANLFGRIFGTLFGIRIILSSMRSDYSKFKLSRFFDKITNKLVKFYVLNSRALLSYIQKLNNVPIKKLKIIPNAVDLEEVKYVLDQNFDIKQELNLPKESFLIVTVGRLIKDKNILILIKAMEFLDENIILLIIGDGPERKKLINYSKKINLQKRIIFLGIRKDVLNIINNSNLFALPSLREGMSNALLEAMALKKTCIVSNISQNKELIKNGHNGITFDPLDENDLATKIMEIYKNKTLKNFGQEAFNTIKQSYNINKIVKKYENFIFNLKKECPK